MCILFICLYAILSQFFLDVENGDTLHLVQRQLNQSQAPGTSSSDTTGTSGDRGEYKGFLPIAFLPFFLQVMFLLQ